MRLGFVGAGNIGQGLARLAVQAGYEVGMSNSRDPATLAPLRDELGIRVATIDQTLEESNVVVLAIPFGRVFELTPTHFAGRIVLDANNYYPLRDGRISELDARITTTSELVQRHLSGSIVVKAFNAILARDLVAPFGLVGQRRALPVATDHDVALTVANAFHERVGLEMVPTGPLEGSWRFERAKPAYCIPLDREGLEKALSAADRIGELPHDSWQRVDT